MITERIMQLRKAKGWSMAELGSRIGVEASTIHKWESGYTKSLKTSRLEQLAQALSTTVDYLLGYVDVPDEKLQPVIRTAEENELLRIYRELDIKKRNRLLAYAWDLEDDNTKFEVTKDENGEYRFKLK